VSMNDNNYDASREPKNRPGDETEPGSEQSAEGICHECGGSGSAGEETCPRCDGSGVVTVIVGDA
jgi:DnaJ-class molecular chaperone